VGEGKDKKGEEMHLRSSASYFSLSIAIRQYLFGKRSCSVVYIVDCQPAFSTFIARHNYPKHRILIECTIQMTIYEGT
jgi:hypothetical protein